MALGHWISPAEMSQMTPRHHRNIPGTYLNMDITMFLTPYMGTTLDQVHEKMDLGTCQSVLEVP